MTPPGHLRAVPDPADDDGMDTTAKPKPRRRRRYVRTRADGTRAYPVRYTKPDGSVGQETFDTAQAADEFRAEIRARKRVGVKVDTATTVDDLAAAWGRQRVSKLEEKTQQQHSSSLTNRILPWGGHMRVLQWTRQTTRKFIAWMEESGDVRACRRDDGTPYGRWDRVPVDHPDRRPAGAATIRLTTSTLYGLLQHALDDGIIASNPAADAPRPKERESERRALTSRELELLGMACTALGRPRARAMIVLAAFTGMRQQDIRALEWRDIDWKAGMVLVRRAADDRGRVKTTKSGKETVRRVPLFTLAREAMEQLHEATPVRRGLVFPSEAGTILSPSNIRRDVWLPAKRAAALGLRWELAAAGADDADIEDAVAGLLALTFHELRHTFVSMVGSSGLVPQSVGMAWSGHRSPSMWKRYEHLFDDASEQAAARLDSWLTER